MPQPQYQWQQSLPGAYSIAIPARDPMSTNTGHYRLWQETKDPNLDLNRVPNAQIFSCNMKSRCQRLCFIFLLLSSLGLLTQNSMKRKAIASQKIFWRPWQNGWVSITVMRRQEWRPRFPHLCHLSLCLLQGIHSLLYNSLLSLLLLPLFLIPFLLSQKFTSGVYICARVLGRNVLHEKAEVNKESSY